jgi:glyoxylase I family protein
MATSLSSGLAAKLFVDHLVLVVSDIGRTGKFYSKIFGEPAHQNERSLVYNIGWTRLFLVLPHGELPPGDVFSPNRIGLEHFAIGIGSLEELREVEDVLNAGGIVHSGIHIDSNSKREKIWLNDPDKIRIEFFIYA